ncbi:MAG: hypothetical protein KF858_01120 [Candidatus Sumerlaeia bacterium]|nr:hypothetical protein [Candidatus Sumerlaeia bacterium]
MHRMVLVACVVLCATWAWGEEGASRLLGRVVVPEGVEAARLSVIVHDRAISEAENDFAPKAMAAVDARGLFEIEHAASETTELEVVGPGIRRARFPWPRALQDDAGQRAVFRVSPGNSFIGDIADAETGAPIVGALIGPIVPGEDAPGDARRLSYPFFVRSDEAGRIAVEGVLPRTSYSMHVSAEGYMRRRIDVRPGMPFGVRLRRGGVVVAAQVLGARTLEPRGGVPVLLMGGPEDFHLMRRADSEGRVAFDGLPMGNYHLVPVVPAIGAARPTEIAVSESVPPGEWFLYVPEGIEVSGQVLDVETDEPVADARVTIRDKSVASDERGRFRFERIEGPLPVEALAAHPDYLFRSEDQDPEYYPLSGYADRDVEGFDLKLRRVRVLEWVRMDGDEPLVSGVAELRALPGTRHEGVVRHRLDARRTVVPLESAGRRVALLRAAGGLASDLVMVETAIDATTTTVALALAPGATIEGWLRFRNEDPPRAPSFRPEVVAQVSGEEVAIAESRAAPNGTFRLEGLPPGEMLLRLVRDDGTAYIEERVTLTRGETVRIERELDRGLPFAGTVVDSDGILMAGVQVAAYGRDTLGKPLHQRRSTGRNGAFRFEDFGGPELDSIAIDHFDRAPFREARIALPAEDYLIVLQPRAGITVTVQAPAEQLQDGEVLLLTGRRVGLGDGTEQWFYETVQREPLAGRAEVTVAPRSSGNLRVAATAGGQWDVSPGIEWTESEEERAMTLVPASNARVVVTVLGAAGSTPEALLLNTVLPESRTRVEFEPTEAREGLLVFEGLPAGVYSLIAHSATGAASRSNIEVARGQTVRLEIDLAPPEQELAGLVVIGADRKPGAGARLALRYGDVPEAAVLMETVADSAGVFFFDSLPAGRPYLVDVTHGGATRRFSVEARRSGRIEREFVLATPTAVRLVAGPQVLARLQRNAGAPVILQHESDTRVLRAADLAEPQALLPGRHVVFVGEDRVGVLDVPESSRAVELTLPGG